MDMKKGETLHRHRTRLKEHKDKLIWQKASVSAFRKLRWNDGEVQMFRSEGENEAYEQN